MDTKKIFGLDSVQGMGGALRCQTRKSKKKKKRGKRGTRFQTFICRLVHTPLLFSPPSFLGFYPSPRAPPPSPATLGDGAPHGRRQVEGPEQANRRPPARRHRRRLLRHRLQGRGGL